jgi:hypothetical protein
MGRLEKLARRMTVKKGKIPCPECGEPQKDPPRKTEVATCSSCGFRGSHNEWAIRRLNAEEEGYPNPDIPPADTRITRKELAPGTVAWEIPPSGKAGGLLGFGIIWTAFICFWTVGVILGSDEGDGGTLTGPLFSIPFWAIGIGMLYFGLRAKYAFHLLMVDPKTVVLARSFFKRTSRKALQRSTLKSAEKKEFYQQNYTPVYGVEIKGKDGKIRFGTTLSEEEKNWLVADLQRHLFPEEVKAKTPPPTAATTEQAVASAPKKIKPFSVDFPPARAPGSTGGLCIGFLVIGGFIAVGIFFLKDAGFFRWIWLGGNSLFALGMIAAALTSWRNRNRVLRVRGDRTGIHIETLRGRVPLKEERMDYEPGIQVHSYNTGRNGNTSMVRIELLGETTVVPLLKWYPEEAAQEPIAELRAALGGS